MFVWTFGLSPPDASACCSDAAFAAYSAASCRSEVMLWTKRYPEDPAPRGLAGQELGTLERQKKKKKGGEKKEIQLLFHLLPRHAVLTLEGTVKLSGHAEADAMALLLPHVAYPKPDRLRKKPTRDKTEISTKSWHSLPYTLPTTTTEQC